MKTFQVQDYIQLCFHEKQGGNINFNVFSVIRNDLDIHLSAASTAQKMKFSVKDFFSICDQIRSAESLIFCAVLGDFICKSKLVRLSCRNEF